MPEVKSLISTKTVILLIIAMVIGLLVALQVVGPILENPMIVQDDFRQTNFWFWQLWEPSLFQDDFFAESAKIGYALAPIYFFIWKSIIPAFFADLIYASKVYAIILSVLGAGAAYLFISKITGDKNKFLSLSFVLSMSVVFWCTDHVSASHVRSSVWLILLLYLWLKSSRNDLWAGLICLPALFFNPTAFLLCMGTEGFSWLLKIKNGIFNKTFYIGLFNTLVTVLYHFVFKGGVQYAGNGKSLSAEAMRSMPEFNPGGRSAIFGSYIWDGSWWTNEHWGFGYGYLEISKVVFIALGLIVLYFLIVRPKADRLVAFSTSSPALLVYSSLTLYVFSQILFPVLYFPSRYISVSFILLSVALFHLCVYELALKFSPLEVKSESLTRAQKRNEKKQKDNSADLSKNKFYHNTLFICVGLVFWGYFQGFYHPRYVSINPKIAHIAAALPKDSLVAGHPLIPDLNTLSIVSKRKVYVDYERSLLFTDKGAEEVRRRTRNALALTFAKSKEEFLGIANKEGITHFLALYDFYHPKYLANPLYIEPFNEYLKKITKLHEEESFFIESYLKTRKLRYGMIDINGL